MRDGVQKILALDTSSVVSVACVTVGSGDVDSAGVEVVAEHETDSTTRHAETSSLYANAFLPRPGGTAPTRSWWAKALGRSPACG